MMPTRKYNNQNWLPSIFNDFFDNEWLTRANATAPAINVIESDKDYKVEVAAPVEVKKATDAANGVRQEKVTVVSGNGDNLKDYSVVCGSFGLKANAEGLKEFLDAEGYNATIAFNAESAMYRVIVSTFADRASAAQARDAFKAKYPNRKDFQGAWLLYRVF